ncbi:nucleoside-triphosphatase [Desulfitobacterium sp. THU1]|uniref:nucleoside-triphosphatase n=1 Tax=Desulfitobacterium sp. THU1 TaxID=3138072 RepID=UPI00311D6D42
MPNNLLITGQIRSGKSTLLKSMIDPLKSMTGGYFVQRLFVQEETRAFRLVDIAQESYLPNRHVEDVKAFSDIIMIKGEGSPINYEVFRTIGTSSLRSAGEKKQLILMDELGTMETAVPEFKEAVTQALDKDITVLGVLKKKANPFLDQIKARPDVLVLDMDYWGPDRVREEVRKFLAKNHYLEVNNDA